MGRLPPAYVRVCSDPMDKPIILTVDDDPQVLRSIARDLRQKYGDEYSVLRADSGRQALETLDQLADAANPVALLLSDQRMPEMDGVSFLKQARQRFPDSKRALLTAYADTDAAIAAINESQVDYYLTKPWDPPVGAALSVRRRPARRLEGASQDGLRRRAHHRQPLDEGVARPARLPRSQSRALHLPRHRDRRRGASGWRRR